MSCISLPTAARAGFNRCAFFFANQVSGSAALLLAASVNKSALKLSPDAAIFPNTTIHPLFQSASCRPALWTALYMSEARFLRPSLKYFLKALQLRLSRESFSVEYASSGSRPNLPQSTRKASLLSCRAISLSSFSIFGLLPSCNFSCIFSRTKSMNSLSSLSEASSESRISSTASSARSCLSSST